MDMHEVQRQLGRVSDQFHAHGGEEYVKKVTQAGDWHIDALCIRVGFTHDEANIIKSQYDCVLQEFFGGNTAENTPQQYKLERKSTRNGDPTGLIGSVFSLSRKIYFALENVPVVNNLRLWAAIDRLILGRSNHPVVQNYLAAIAQGFTPRTAH
ncbi:MAG: hypothetical protein AB8B99_22710 [Phormidesmis sp.]